MLYGITKESERLLKAYEYILTVAEQQSISAAAEVLGIAQPSLSRFIVKLEKDLGTELFDRSTIPLQLTEAGRCFALNGQKMLDLNRQVMKQLAEIRSERSRTIRIGMGPSRAPAILPEILKAFHAVHPEVCVSTEEARTAQLLEQLSSGNLDMVITFLDDSMASFGMKELFLEQVSLAVHQSFLPELQKAMTPSGAVCLDRLGIPFVSLHVGQQLRIALDILSGGMIHPIYDSEYLESAMALVSAGFGATLAPSYWKYVASESAKLCYFPVEIPDFISEPDRRRLDAILNRKIGIFYRKEQFLTETEKTFITCAKSACSRFA